MIRSASSLSFSVLKRTGSSIYKCRSKSYLVPFSVECNPESSIRRSTPLLRMTIDRRQHFSTNSSIRSDVKASTVAEGSSVFDELIEASVEDAKDQETSAELPGSKSSKAIINSLPKFTTGNMRTSPKKLNILARLVQGMTIHEAYRQMSITLKRRGRNVASTLLRIKKALKHNYGISSREVYIKRAFVGKGVYLKRIRFHGRGRAGRMLRRSAHIRFELAPYKNLATQQEKNFAKLAHLLRRHKLYQPLREHLPVLKYHQPWSKKPWKYVTSAKWMNPENAYSKKMLKYSSMN